MSKKAPVVKYKLTKEDKEWLSEHYFSLEDIFEMSHAIPKTTYTDEYGYQLSVDEVIHRMGKVAWLKTIGRSAFHVNATGYDLQGHPIKFFSKVFEY